MESKFLTAEKFEELFSKDKFKLNEAVDIVNLMNFKHERVLLLKLPSQSNKKNPHDGYVWSRTKYTKERKVEYRHQPTYSKIQVFGETVQTMRCTEYNNQHIHKQVFIYLDHIYVYYFTTSSAEIPINDAPAKRLTKQTKETLLTTVLPYRSVNNAIKVAYGMDLDVTRKQIQNLARSAPNSLACKSGPRSRTWNDWILFVDRLQSADEDVRRREIRRILAKNPTGVFMPSRMHVDKTFNVGDVYVTVVLGETSRFRTKSSIKPRVIPLGYMCHSSKSSTNHLKFANCLKEEFAKHKNPADPRKIPCVLLDGEAALEHYPEVLESSAVRCDLHVLSLLRFDYGGKKAATTAKPFIFGKKKDGKWRSGILGCFDEQTFDRRLRQSQSHIDPRIFSWLQTNKSMLMESSSAYAKLRAGHILQYSTNNQNETFNGILKVNITKRHAAPELIRRLDSCCEEKLRECWLSAIDGSDYVIFRDEIDGLDHDERIEVYNSAGLQGSRILSLNLPLKIAEGFDLKKIFKEDLASTHLQILRSNGDMIHIEDPTLPKNDRNRFVHLSTDESTIECWTCGTTLPEYLCSHVIFSLSQLSPTRLAAFWANLKKKKNTKVSNGFSGGSGSKISDRIGIKSSAQNYVRTMNDVSSLTIDSDCSTLAGSSQPSPSQPNITSFSIGHYLRFIAFANKWSPNLF
ncbi:hypothetical protein L3Y34_019084 [Caenorhabditis briggsae]|uniref:SWIM-type domain-containing protein n=1 Tax=Caenorhabditis briggsae TaxID=6238 RepID=A0AAE9IW80_CAEBR|nr:hypothetical protein L3Y34_019084 [Caenorhabditis briggsae]